MLTLPDDIVRIGSTWWNDQSHDYHMTHTSTHYYSNKGLLVFLISHLSVYVNTRQPAPVTRVTVVPTQGIL